MEWPLDMYSLSCCNLLVIIQYVMESFWLHLMVKVKRDCYSNTSYGRKFLWDYVSVRCGVCMRKYRGRQVRKIRFLLILWNILFLLIQSNETHAKIVKWKTSLQKKIIFILWVWLAKHFFPIWLFVKIM